MTDRRDHGLRYLVNCSILFAELPLLERPAAAKAAGFDAVEFWWPWPDQPVPADRDVDAFVTAVQDAGVQLVGLNFFAGDLGGPDCGVLSIPDRVHQFRDNIEVTVGIGERLGASAFNALFGNRVEGVDPHEQDELGRESIALAAKAAGAIGATVLVEVGQWPQALPAADRGRRRRGRPGRPGDRCRQRRVPARPLPPGCERRRPRRCHRRPRRRHRARPDRRRPRSRGARHRGARPPAPPARPRCCRVCRVGGPGVQAHHRDHPRELRLARARPPLRLRLTSPYQGETS